MVRSIIEVVIFVSLWVLLFSFMEDNGVAEHAWYALVGSVFGSTFTAYLFAKNEE